MMLKRCRSCRWLTALAVVLLIAVVTVPQQSLARPSLEPKIDTSLVNASAPLVAGIMKMLQTKPAERLQGNNYRLTDLRLEEHWALISLAALDHTNVDSEAVGMGSAGSLLIAQQAEDQSWQVALEGTPAFLQLVRTAPNHFLNTQAKHNLTTNTTGGPATTVDYKFPWAAGVSWQWWTGWHDVVGTQAGLDLGTNGSDTRVLVSATGTVNFICRSTPSSTVGVRDANGVGVAYAHVQTSTLDPSIQAGTNVQQGQVLGNVVLGNFNDHCGLAYQHTGTGHIHFSLPTNQAMTFDGWTIQYPNNYFDNGGQRKTCIANPQNQTCATPYPSFLSSNQPGGSANPPVPANQNLVQNGDFSAGSPPAPWWLFGDANWAINNGVLAFKRTTGGSGGSVGQNLNYTVPPTSPFEIKLDLGNTSSVVKTPGVILHSSAGWDNAIRCTFTIPPNTPLQTYIVRGRTDGSPWNGMVFEVWPDPPDSIPDVLMDNVSVTQRPDLNSQGTECDPPASTTLDSRCSTTAPVIQTSAVQSTAATSSSPNTLVDAGLWSSGFATSGDSLCTGDFDGNGYGDIIAGTTRDNGSANPLTWYVMKSNGSSFVDGGLVANSFGMIGDSFYAGDFDGDGKADLLAATTRDNGSSGALTWYLLKSNGSAFVSAGKVSDGFGMAADKFYIGDFDGDGKADVLAATTRGNGVGNPLTWYVMRSNGTSFTNGPQVSSGFGMSDDRFYIADFDGDKKVDIMAATTRDNGLSNPLSWYLMKSNGSLFVGAGRSSSGFGFPGDDFSVGDFDGDGKADIIAAIGRMNGDNTLRWYVTGLDNNNQFVDLGNGTWNPQWGQVGDRIFVQNYRDGVHTPSVSADVTVARQVNGVLKWYLMFSDYVSPASANPPAAPSNLLISGTTQSSVSLSWQDNSTDEGGFTIYRWDSVGNRWQLWASVGPDETSFTDTGLTCGTSYQYQVDAWNSSANSNPTTPVTATTSVCTSLGHQVFVPLVSR